MTKQINWKRIYKTLGHFFDRCGGVFETMVYGFLLIAILMGPVALLTSFFSKMLPNICGYISLTCFGAVAVSFFAYGIGFFTTIMIKFVLVIIEDCVGMISKVREWLCGSK